MSRTRHHGYKAKKRLFGYAFKWWNSTPSWFVRMYMTKPQRKEVKMWERDATMRNDVELVDLPPHGKKPHKYYW